MASARMNQIKKMNAARRASASARTLDPIGPTAAKRPLAASQSSYRRRSRKVKKANNGHQATGLTVLLVLLGVLVPFPGLAVILLTGLLPTLTAVVLLGGPRGYQGLLCVACFNLIGVGPYALAVWEAGASLDDGIVQLSNIYSWLTMYSAAGIGWLLLGVTPTFAAFYLQFVADDKRRRLQSMQEALIKEWGDDVMAGLDQPDQES